MARPQQSFLKGNNSLCRATFHTLRQLNAVNDLGCDRRSVGIVPVDPVRRQLLFIGSLDPALHHGVASAGHAFEPRTIHLHKAGSCGFDRADPAELSYCQRHCRSTDAEQLRTRLLCQWKYLVRDAVLKLEKRSPHAALYGMQRVARSNILQLQKRARR